MRKIKKREKQKLKLLQNKESEKKEKGVERRKYVLIYFLITVYFLVTELEESKGSVGKGVKRSINNDSGESNKSK